LSSIGSIGTIVTDIAKGVAIAIGLSGVAVEGTIVTDVPYQVTISVGLVGIGIIGTVIGALTGSVFDTIPIPIATSVKRILEESHLIHTDGEHIEVHIHPHPHKDSRQGILQIEMLGGHSDL
jgi:hypothetical protein